MKKKRKSAREKAPGWKEANDALKSAKEIIAEVKRRQRRGKRK